MSKERERERVLNFIYADCIIVYCLYKAKFIDTTLIAYEQQHQ
jgi:hypothetical protein